ncbi:unnamed protein product [Rhodiola kirilowii]
MTERGRDKVVEDIADEFQGRLMVSLEDADWEKMKRSFRWALVLKLANGMAFNITGLGNVLSKVWNLELDKRVRFKELASNMALSEFEYAVDMARVRDGGPWLCLNSVALFHEWCPELAPEEIRMNRLRVWAQLHNLPLGAVLTDKDTEEKLAGYIGKFIRVDTEGAKKKFIRVRVEIDIEKPVVTGFYLRRQNRDPIWISVKYERLPSLCQGCGRLSHEGEECMEEAEPRTHMLRSEDGNNLMVPAGNSGNKLTEKVRKLGVAADERRIEVEQGLAQGGAEGKSIGKEIVQPGLCEASTWIDETQNHESLMEVEVRLAVSGNGKSCHSVQGLQNWKAQKQEGGNRACSKKTDGSVEQWAVGRWATCVMCRKPNTEVRVSGESEGR